MSERSPSVSALTIIRVLLTVLALNLIGEGLNDALNPRLSRKSK